MKLTIKETSLFKFAKEEDSADKKSLEPEFTIEGATLKNCKTNGCKVIKIPAKVTVIGDYAFYRSDVEEVILPNGLKTIGEAAFYQCSRLKKISFPEKLERIKHFAFKSCIALESVDFPKEMLYIESSAFENSGLKHVTLPKKMIHHDRNGENIFAETALETVNIPKNFSLETGMFADCHQLKSVKLSCGKSVSKNCFAGCKNLETVKLPDSVNVIDYYAFSECTSLRSINLDKVQIIGSSAFVKTALEYITLSARKIGSGAFAQCENLKKADLSGIGTKKLDSRLFFECMNLNKISLPKNQIKIFGGDCFYHTAIKEITFDTEQITVGLNAFGKTNLKKVVISENCNDILFQDYAFREAEVEEFVIPDFLEKVINHDLERMF